MTVLLWVYSSSLMLFFERLRKPSEHDPAGDGLIIQSRFNITPLGLGPGDRQGPASATSC